ncbi:glutathione S-transferase family protein [Neisseria zalophi]|uniref:glutathione S-transferase family protein n=1 Tax=Neisseria zalophi TaxID=640030 RepID=UPI001CDA3686|nr:glutathione binding-like protein [Neisseria zalophi]
MIKLYILPGACSFVPHTALEWAKADYELNIMPRDELKSEAYLSINPQGSVPAIVDGDTVVSQNIAVQMYINALYPKANIFGGDNSPKHIGEIMHWLAFLNSDVHKAFGLIFAPDKLVSDEKAVAELTENARNNIVKMLKHADDQLSKQDYLTGQISTADLYLYIILRWSKSFALDLSAYKSFNPFISRVEADAGVQEALRQEGLEKIVSL